MQFVSDKAWAEQMSEFEADETSKTFGMILQEWVKNIDTEQISDRRSQVDGSEGAVPEGTDQDRLSLQVSKALEVTEQTYGFLSIEWLSQMLMLITANWVLGERLYEDLSFMEKRLVDQATAIKLAELASHAKLETPTHKE